MKLIIAPDSFRGSMTNCEAAAAMEKGVKSIHPNANIITMPIGDGGEGTIDVLVASMNGSFIKKVATGPLGKKVKGYYGISKDKTIAIIEMALFSGISLITKRDRNPLYTTTYGLGEVVKDVLKAGYRNLIICAGGSCTNDAGAGMAQALGVKFFRKTNREITNYMCGELLNKVVKIDMSGLHPAVLESNITVACDVNIPLLGPNGCANLFAPQKGATVDIVKRLEMNMHQFIERLENQTGLSVRNHRWAGASGGLGLGLKVFLNAKLTSGINLVLKKLNIKKVIMNTDIILTGEGKIDYMTTLGKAINGVVNIAQKHNIPVIAFAGSVQDVRHLNKMGLKNIYSICNRSITLEQSMKKAPTLLQQVVEKVMKGCSIESLGI